MMKFYLILSLIELAMILAFAVCVFHNYNKSWNLIARVLITVFLILINIVELMLEIRLEQSIVLTIIMIVMWGTNFFVYYPQLKKRVLNQK